MESNADEILATYLAESADPAAERLLHTLIVDVAAPHVRVVVGSNLRGRFQSESSDASQEVLLDLTSHLRRLRETQLHAPRSAEPPIRSFRAYIGSAARRAAGIILRRSNPERYRLRNRIRYSLRHAARFSLTEDDQGRPLASLSHWPAVSAANPETTARLRALAVPPRASAMPLPQLIEAALTPLKAPVLLDDLTDFIGNALGGFARQEEFEAAVAVPSSNLAEQMDQRAWLGHLWTEILELPPNQRAALLLNLRDHIGDCALRVLPASGIASIRQIAAALEMPPETLATLWKDLPIDDMKIAGMLSLTRQQVVNLRKSARDRLQRRMGTRK